MRVSISLFPADEWGEAGNTEASSLVFTSLGERRT